MKHVGRTHRLLVPTLVAAVLAIGLPALAMHVAPTDPASTAIRARPPGTPLYNWLSTSFPTILIVAGGLIVLVVLRARAKAARMPQPLSLEERFARLAAESRGRDDDTPSQARPEPARLSLTPARAGTTPDRRTPPNRPDSLDGVIRDTEELAQRLAAAMDARADRLESLIRDADDRLRRLEAARSGTGMNSGAGGVLDEPSFERRRGEPVRSAPVQAFTPARSLPPSFDADAHDPIHRQVFDLADQGLGSLDIARTLGQPTGQVELILALRGR